MSDFLAQTKATLLILLLAPAGVGFGATYYVSPSGSNTAPYDTWAKAALLPSTVITAGDAVEGPHTVNIGINLGSVYRLDFDGRDQNDHGGGWEIGPYVYYELKSTTPAWRGRYAGGRY